MKSPKADEPRRKPRTGEVWYGVQSFGRPYLILSDPYVEDGEERVDTPHGFMPVWSLCGPANEDL